MDWWALKCQFLFCTAAIWTIAGWHTATASDRTAGEAVADVAVNPGSPEPAQSVKRGPRWLKWDAEFRGRVELPSAVEFTAGHNDQLYLHRIRASADIDAATWLRLHVQGQDARAAGFTHSEELSSEVHYLDFRQAYVDFGPRTGAWGVTAGRQEVALGDERLVGSDNYWDPLGQTFDGVRLRYQRVRWRLTGFSASVVPGNQRISVTSHENRLDGLYLSLDVEKKRGVVLEPYLFHNHKRRVSDVGVVQPESDVFTYGARSAGNLPERLDYTIEMALQGGHKYAKQVSAWAGHWEMGVRPLGGESGPRFGVEYNVASGDRNPQDGRHTTFDDLYPAGYNKFGMADPFAWRNVRYVSTGVDWGFHRRWRVSAGYRDFWLHTAKDGLYVEGDDCLTRNPSASSGHIGSQTGLMVAWEFSQRWQFYAGYARLFPGQYLVDASYRGHFSSPYFMLNFKVSE